MGKSFTSFEVELLIKKFSCMASICEVLVDSQDPLVLGAVAHAIETEALRIEGKYSRYKTDNIVHQINTADGKPVSVDSETAALIDYAFECFDLSDGLFDITSGVLRKIWNFKNFTSFPSTDDLRECLKNVGLQKIKWTSPTLQMKSGMEIDFGGIVKEYAVDRCLALAAKISPVPTLINFGGDLAVNKPPQSGSWNVAIEEAFKKQLSKSQLHLKNGAIATSGDTHRFLEHKGQRYSHILNPKTGLPVSNGIASITVMAPTCTLAGILSTVAHLQEDPVAFLKAQEIPHWIVKHS